MDVSVSSKMGTMRTIGIRPVFTCAEYALFQTLDCPISPVFDTRTCSPFDCRHPSVVSISHHDERGAGFYAVGFARARRGGIDGANRDGIGKGAASDTSGSEEGLRLCAVVTSSGTAVANLLPAAAEADAAGLPILLLTADRPPELRGCGSNQTIDQVFPEG